MYMHICVCGCYFMYICMCVYVCGIVVRMMMRVPDSVL